MEVRTAYCSACDQSVRIVVTPASRFSGQAPVSDQPDVVCLDFGERCTGALCPMIGLPRILMGMRLAQSGLRPENFQHVRGPCAGCGDVVEMEVLDRMYARCPDCGTRNRWLHIRVEDGEYIAVMDAES